jgi:hypothetical protein
LSQQVRSILNLPAVARESLFPIHYEILAASTNKKITDQDSTDASIEIILNEGLNSGEVRIEIYNLSQAKVDQFKEMARNNDTIAVKLGYKGYTLEEVGRYVLVDQEQQFETREEQISGTYDRVLSLRGLEPAAWLCQNVNVNYSSEKLTPVDHVKKLIGRANAISPTIKVAVAAFERELDEAVLFESHYSTLANALFSLADQFGYKVQTIGDVIIFTHKTITLGSSRIVIDGETNAISFVPTFDYEPTQKDTDNFFLSKTSKTNTGYRFEMLGNPKILMWKYISAKNVDFEKGFIEERKRDDLVIAEVEHQFNSQNGYICRGRLIADSKEIPEEPTHTMTPHPSTDTGFSSAVSGLVDSITENIKTVVVGEIQQVDDEEFKGKYIITTTTGMDFLKEGKRTSRYSRFLPVPKSSDESYQFRTISEVTIASPYLGNGYGFFFPISYDEEIPQRAVIINHEDESDPVIVGFVLTDTMANDPNKYPKHNAGDIYLHTRAHSKLLFPTRVDDETSEAEIGSGIIQSKSFVLEIGESYLTVDRPTPDSPNKIRITQDYGGNKNHFILNDDGKIRIIHKATSETVGDVVLVIEDGTITITGADISITGDLTVDGDIEATGDVSGLTGTFGP